MNADSFHRLEKALVDSGEFATIEEVDESFSRYGVRVVLNQDIEHDLTSQVIALTVINTAARCFQGRVQVVVEHDIVLQVPGYVGCTLGEFMKWISVKETSVSAVLSWPTIAIGKTKTNDFHDMEICPWADGWEYGIGKCDSSTFFAPACVAAAGLAVSEAFSILRGDNPAAGRRSLSMSLWSVIPDGSTKKSMERLLIPSIWLMGLGHLGQAYSWLLGFMQPEVGATIWLQDVDIITESTLSTSMLSVQSDIKEKKTRVVARWLESRGYSTSIVERYFDQAQRVGKMEPRQALFGVDNAAARRVLENAGFRLVLDAGLGSGYQDFRAIRIRAFPGPSMAESLWGASDVKSSNNLGSPAYKTLLEEGMDPCGVATLASRAVGAPFVGCVASAYVIAELLRRQIDGPVYGYVDLNLRNPKGLDALRVT